MTWILEFFDTNIIFHTFGSEYVLLVTVENISPDIT